MVESNHTINLLLFCLCGLAALALGIGEAAGAEIHMLLIWANVTNMHIIQ
jgi:hypothetical protein